jgi:hypothetical protein
MAENILDVAAGGSNAVALQVLHSFKTASGSDTPVDYYRAGDTANLPTVLTQAGLAAEILGPPTDLSLVAQMDNKAHQYLTSSDPDEEDDARGQPLFARPFLQRSHGWPAGPAPLYSETQIKQNIARSQPDILAAAAQSADNAINNQSIVVLFTFAGKTMLFCGDAQWGNWANFLFGGPIGTGPATLTENSSKILGALDFYKVGHHGSTNATPIDVVKALRLGCAAMCSTDPGAYGNPDKGTEVPRIPLLDALKTQTQGRLARSDQVEAGGKAPDPALGALNAAFTSGAGGSTYIDFNL